MTTTKPINEKNTFIQQSLSVKAVILNAEPDKVKPLKPDLSDLVVISQLATEQQQQITQLAPSKQIKEIAIDTVNVSSTTGKARSRNNLTNNQAIELYQKIAKLL